MLKKDGQVDLAADGTVERKLDKSRAAAEAAIRVAVKEFEANGKASIQSVAEAKSQLYAYGKPASNNEPAPTATKPRSCSSSLRAWNRSSTASRASDLIPRNETDGLFQRRPAAWSLMVCSTARSEPGR